MSVQNISDAFSDILLKSWLTRDLSALPTSFFIGLTLALPTDQNGLGILEPTNAEYHRLEVVAESDSWESMGEGSRLMTLQSDLLYAEAVTDWGQILGYTIHDSLVDGLYIGYGETNTFPVTAGMRARIPAGTLVVAEGASDGRGGAPFWFDLSNDAPFPPEAIIGDYGFDPVNGNVWRNA